MPMKYGRMRVSKYLRKKGSKKTGKSIQYPFPRRNRVTLPGYIGVGESLTTNLKTSFFANVASGGTSIFNCYLKPGSAFDPTGDLATIQPVGYDLFAAVFNRYKVNNAHVTVTISGVNGKAAENYNWVAAMYPSVDSTAVATYQGAASQAYSKTFRGGFSVVQTGAALVGVSNTQCTRSIYIDNEAVTGAQGTSYDIGALVTADPTTLQYAVLPIFLQGNTGGSVCTWVIQVEMVQNVTFNQRKNPVDA